MYQVKSTFVTRKGQFIKDKETEAVGIDAHALKGIRDFEFTVGGDPDTIYYASVESLRRAPSSVWINKKGKKVLIFPMFAFKTKINGQQKLL